MSLPPGLINLDHYTAAAQAMSEMDEHKAQMDASRQVSQKLRQQLLEKSGSTQVTPSRLA